MKIKRIWFLMLLCVCWSSLLHAQDKLTISGYIKDAQTGEELIGANVYIKEKATGTTSNVYGFYSITLPKGTYNFVYSYVGYKALNKQIILSEGNQKLDIELQLEGKQLDALVVEGEAEKPEETIQSVEMSVNKVSIATIQKMPALLGEVDIVKSIQLLPGVTSVGEGSSGFNVRGGNIDQNLILLDEAPVYNSSHLFGFFSVFNPDAVKDLKLLKGGIPSQYGGRISSILDVRMKEGNKKRFSAQGGLGMIFSRLTLEAPIIKDKASFIIAARRSYIDILAKPFLKGDLKGSQFYFYDLTAKLNYSINNKNKLFLSGYLGRDVFGAGFKFNWGNSTTSLRWNHIFNDRLFLNTTLFYSNYDYRLEFKAFGNSDDYFKWKSNIINYSLKPEFTYYLNTKNTITFGGQTIFYDFRPGTANGLSGDQVSTVGLENKKALESGVYIGNEQEINEQLSLQYGVRYSLFSYLGKGTAYEYDNAPAGERRKVISEKQYKDWESIQNYGYFEPRFSAKYSFSASSSLKMSYNRIAQYIHLLSNTAAATPLDVWTPSTNNIKPQIGDQVAMGFFKNFGVDNAFETSVETYYKSLQNQLDYINGADLLLNKYIEGDLLSGDGRAYGVELYAKKNAGKMTGWVSYTLARTERRVEGINNHTWFPSRFDKTHNLSMVAMYDFTKRLSFSANFTFASGTPATFPTSRVVIQDYVIPYNAYNSRNNYRIPPYHRLDLALTLKNKEKEGKRWQGEWVFSVYNVYKRRNPYSIYVRTNPDDSKKTEAIRYSVVGTFIPSVTYNFKY